MSQIEVKEIEHCKLSITYEADAAQILDKRAEVIAAFKKAPVPGSRPGRASVDAIKMHYRSQIEDAVKRALAEDAYHNTLFEKKLRPHGAPKFNTLLLADGKFTCQFDMFTKPDFELSAYTNLEIPKPHEPQNAIHLAEQMMQELRVRFGEVSPYVDGDFVEAGDNVIVDYLGTVDGEKVESISATGEMLTVGRSHISIFDDNLLGMSLGETREFDMTVPEGGLPSLSGKTIHFKVTLNMGSKTVPCALDDKLAEKLGKKDFSELKEFVHATAGAKIAHAFKISLNEAVSAKLVSDNVFAVPNWMTVSEAQYLAHNAKLDWNALPDVDKEKYIGLAEKNVRLALILDKIREVEPEAQLTDQEVFDIIKTNIAHTKVDKPVDDIIQEMNKSGYLQILFSRIRDEYALDYVVKKTRVIE